MQNSFIVAFLFLAITTTLFSDGLGNDDVEKDDIGDCPCKREIFNPEQRSGVLKSPNYSNFTGCVGTCTYEILPDQNSSVTLYTSLYELSPTATLEIFALVYYNDEKILIPHATIRRTNNFYYSSGEQTFPTFVSAKNAGFEIRFRSNTKNHISSFKISFDRFGVFGPPCDYPLRVVGKEETVIQMDHLFRSSSGCVYKLIPKEEDMVGPENKFFIKIHDAPEIGENMIQMRLPDENGIIKETNGFTSAVTLFTSTISTQIFSHRTTRTDGDYKFAKISAQLRNTTCICPPEDNYIDKDNDTSVTLRSPGYPDLFCAAISCKSQVYPMNFEYNENRIILFDVSLKAIVAKGDSLKIESSAHSYFKSSEFHDMAEAYSERFVIKQQGLSIKWDTGALYHRRHFELNVTEVTVAPECGCSQFREKVFTTDGHFEYVFPSTCSYIYCHFTFSPPGRNNKEYVIDFGAESASFEDEVIIKSPKNIEKYEGAMLGTTRRYEVVDNCEFTFFRENVKTDSKTTLHANYFAVDGPDTCDGKTERHLIEVGETVILTSPDYPHHYANDQNCLYILDAEEGTRMMLSFDEISLENYHDYLNIYLGESADWKNLMQTYTNHHSHKTLNVTQYPITIQFLVDESNSDRGFHISITAIPIHTPIPHEDNSYIFGLRVDHIVWFLVGCLLSIAVYISMKKLWEKYGKKCWNRRKQRAADETELISFNGETSSELPTGSVNEGANVFSLDDML